MYEISLSSLFSFKVHIYKSLKHTDCGLWFCSCFCTAIVSYIVVEMITNISRKIFCSQLEFIMQCWNVSLCQVAGLYRDSSIGNAINIVVVRLILLERDEVKYNTFKNISAKCVHTHAHTHVYLCTCVCVFMSVYSMKPTLMLTFSIRERWGNLLNYVKLYKQLVSVY